MDYWVSYIAYFFDINFPETAKIILDEQYVQRITERIPYGCKDTAQKNGNAVPYGDRMAGKTGDDEKR